MLGTAALAFDELMLRRTTLNSMETISQRLREQLGVPEDMLLSPLDVLRRMKISKVIRDFREDTSLSDAQEAKWDVEQRTVLLSSALWSKVNFADDPEARFTVFHEIGHAVLGHGDRNRLKLGKLQHGRSIERDEMEADDFALAFAIPLYFATDVAKMTAEDVQRQFGLASAMVDRRLVDLQRVSRKAIAYKEDSQDNYAEAMGLMRLNAFSWNSK